MQLLQIISMENMWWNDEHHLDNVFEFATETKISSTTCAITSFHFISFHLPFYQNSIKKYTFICKTQTILKKNPMDMMIDFENVAFSKTIFLKLVEKPNFYELYTNWHYQRRFFFVEFFFFNSITFHHKLHGNKTRVGLYWAIKDSSQNSFGLSNVCTLQKRNQNLLEIQYKSNPSKYSKIFNQICVSLPLRYCVTLFFVYHFFPALETSKHSEKYI